MRYINATSLPGFWRAASGARKVRLRVEDNLRKGREWFLCKTKNYKNFPNPTQEDTAIYAGTHSHPPPGIESNLLIF